MHPEACWIQSGRMEVCAVLIGLLDHGEQVVDGAGRAVEAQDYQDLAGSNIAAKPAPDGRGLCQRHGPPVGVATSRMRLVELRISVLLFSRDPRVADHMAQGGGFA